MPADDDSDQLPENVQWDDPDAEDQSVVEHQVRATPGMFGLPDRPLGESPATPYELRQARGEAPLGIQARPARTLTVQSTGDDEIDAMLMLRALFDSIPPDQRAALLAWAQTRYG